MAEVRTCWLKDSILLVSCSLQMGLEGGSQALERRKLTSREQRFIKFSSVEHAGQVYMTPQDFLESVIEAEPKTGYNQWKPELMADKCDKRHN